MKKINVIIILFFIPIFIVKAQRIGGLCIADTFAHAQESAMLHIISTKKGLLLPTLTFAERDQIKPLTLGLTVFVKDNSYKGFQYWNGHKWIGIEVISDRKASMIAPLGGIIMYHGKFDNFDITGKGLPGTEMEGWQLCNGENGSPDLSGRFIVEGGREGELTNMDKTYGKVGEKKNIPNQIFTLKPENLPRHTHSVNQSVTINYTHTHELYSENKYDLNGKKDSVINGHLHQFLTRHDGSRTSGELSRRDSRRGKNIETDNLSESIDLKNFKVEEVSPRVEFKVDNSSIKAFPEQDVMPKFDNRPQYYVLAFIIRIDENINEGGYKGPFIINY